MSNGERAHKVSTSIVRSRGQGTGAPAVGGLEGGIDGGTEGASVGGLVGEGVGGGVGEGVGGGVGEGVGGVVGAGVGGGVGEGVGGGVGEGVGGEVGEGVGGGVGEGVGGGVGEGVGGDVGLGVGGTDTFSMLNLISSRSKQPGPLSGELAFTNDSAQYSISSQRSTSEFSVVVKHSFGSRIRSAMSVSRSTGMPLLSVNPNSNTVSSTSPLLQTSNP